LGNVAEGNRDCSVCEDVAVPTSSFVESVSLPSESVVADRSRVLSHQASVVLPPLLYGRSPPVHSRLDPRVPPFQPRPHSCSWVEPSPSLSVDRLSSSLTDNDETLVETPLCSGSVYAVDSQDLSVPAHLQDLFDKTVQHANLSLSHQQQLAAVLRKNAEAFATSQLDLGTVLIFSMTSTLAMLFPLTSLRVDRLCPLDKLRTTFLLKC